MNLLEIATNQLHYKRLREDPIYRLQYQLDDMRAEMEPSRCQDIPEKTEEPKPTIIPRFVYFKNDIRALELNNRVTELENFREYLLKKEKELMASAFKRKSKYE